MGSAAHELDDLRQAADRVVFQALSDLVATSADSPASGSAPARLVVVGPGQPGEYEAAGPVSFAGFGRDVEVPALVEGQQSDRDLPTPLMVARYLASREVAAHPEHVELWASARWITTRGADATALGDQLRKDGTRVALILVADGAACHGPKAPQAQDARAQLYDDGVCSALASGQPGRLGQLDVSLGDELGATGPQVWPVLIAAAAGDGLGSTGLAATEGSAGSAGSAGSLGLAGSTAWDGEVLWAGSPYGVGWTVASWRRPRK